MRIFNWTVNKARDTFRNHQIARFAIIGVLNTVFGLLTFPILYITLKPVHIHYMVVMTISYAICILFSYVTSKFLVFKSQEKSLKEFLRFSSFYGINYGINFIVLPISVEILHINPIWTQWAMVLFISASSYLWHKVITFRKNVTQHDVAKNSGN
jgi:putative flippase GtrA